MPSGGGGAAAPAAGGAAPAAAAVEEKKVEKEEEKVCFLYYDITDDINGQCRKSRMMTWALVCSIRFVMYLVDSKSEE